MNKITGEEIAKIIEKMTEIVIENEVYFCELDSHAGDGDFGMSLSKGFTELRNEWENLKKQDIGMFLKDCGMILTEFCGGASGPIWGTAFRSAGKYALGKKEIDITELSELMQSAVDGIKKRGGAQLGDKTLLDALIPAVESVKKSAVDGENFLDAMKKSADEAVSGAEKTKEMIAKKGRASYLGERSIHYPDAGAMAIGFIYTNILRKLNYS